MTDRHYNCIYCATSQYIIDSGVVTVVDEGKTMRLQCYSCRGCGYRWYEQEEEE